MNTDYSHKVLFLRENRTLEYTQSTSHTDNAGTCIFFCVGFYSLFFLSGTSLKRNTIKAAFDLMIARIIKHKHRRRYLICLL